MSSDVRSMAMLQGMDAAMRPFENQGPTILGSTLTVTFLAILTTLARLHVRVRMIQNVGWDDYVMFFSMILCIAGQCIVIPQVHYGAGKHFEHIQPEDFKQGMKLNFISQPLYLVAICFVKLSVGFFLLRIAVRLFFRRLIIGIMIFMGIYTFGCFLTILLQCTDIRMMWDTTVKGTCWTVKQIKILGYTNTVLNMSTDLAFSIGVPIPMLWGIQMNRRHKASLICILALGTFAASASMIKLSYIPNYGRAGDFLWDSRNLTIWTVVECNIGIVAGNLPCLKPLFRSILVSTYGKGTRKITQPKYYSDAYGQGTKQRSAIKSYGPLASPKRENGDFSGHSMPGKAYILTTIDATNTRVGDAGGSESGRSSPVAGSRSSTDSITRLHDHAHRGQGLGNITVTTKVDVTESVHSREHYEGGRSDGRLQTKDLV